MREKAIICNTENTASIIPAASPSRPVVGGEVNAAMTTIKIAKLTQIVAPIWMKPAAMSEAYGWDENATWLVVSGDRRKNEATSRAVEMRWALLLAMSLLRNTVGSSSLLS